MNHPIIGIFNMNHTIFNMNHPIIYNPILGGTQFMFKISIEHPILGVAQP